MAKQFAYKKDQVSGKYLRTKEIQQYYLEKRNIKIVHAEEEVQQKQKELESIIYEKFLMKSMGEDTNLEKELQKEDDLQQLKE